MSPFTTTDFAHQVVGVRPRHRTEDGAVCMEYLSLDEMVYGEGKRPHLTLSQAELPPNGGLDRLSPEDPPVYAQWLATTQEATEALLTAIGFNLADVQGSIRTFECGDVVVTLNAGR